MNTITNIPAPSIPTFSIFKDKKRVDTLIHCFMERSLLTIENPPAVLRAKDGRVYQCVYDKFYIPSGHNAPKIIEIIISFQSHSYGDFAIMRPANSQERYTSPRSTTVPPITNNEITGIEVSDFGPLSL